MVVIIVRKIWRLEIVSCIKRWTNSLLDVLEYRLWRQIVAYGP